MEKKISTFCKSVQSKLLVGKNCAFFYFAHIFCLRKFTSPFTGQVMARYAGFEPGQSVSLQTIEKKYLNKQWPLSNYKALCSLAPCCFCLRQKKSVCHIHIVWVRPKLIEVMKSIDIYIYGAG